MRSAPPSPAQVIVAQLGARMHYAVPVLLEGAGMLAHFYTDTYVGPGSSLHFLTKLAPALPRKFQLLALQRILGRRENGIPAPKVTAFNGFGLRYAWALRGARDAASQEQIFLTYGQRFCQLVLRQEQWQAKGLYAFQSAAAPLFKEAQKFGICRVLEQFIAPVALICQLLGEEHRLWPGWEPPYPGHEVWQPRMQLEKEEWEMAEAILAPSEFVAQGLSSLGVPQKKVHVVPYGVELSRFAVRRQLWDGRRPLRVLFVGAVTLRKGPQYLYRALNRLNSPQLTARLVGPVTIQAGHLRALYNNGELTGPVSRDQVQAHYQWADVFVFPSLCEGSALVTYEALAAGLPVITTAHAGAVVREGQEGFMVPIRDAEALAERLERLAADPGLLADLSRQARARAQEFSWERYGERLAAQVAAILAKSTV